MTSAKDIMIEIREDADKKAWILEYGGPDVTEGSDDWEYWEGEYYRYLESRDYLNEVFGDDYSDEYIDAAIARSEALINEQIDLNIQEQEESERRYKHKDAWNDFKVQILELDDLAKSYSNPNSEILLKIRLSYTVTLMEACLAEMLKAAAFAHDDFKTNAARKLKNVKAQQIPPYMAFTGEGKRIVEKRIYSTLSNLLYHRVLEVFDYYGAVFNSRDFGISSKERKNVLDAMKLRHSIAHRNGKEKSGDKTHIDKPLVDAYVKSIYSFVEAMYGFIEVRLDELEYPAPFEPE